MLEQKVQCHYTADIDSIAGKIVVGVVAGFAILALYTLGKIAYERDFVGSNFSDQEYSLSLGASYQAPRE
jgi:hypothetical protein